MRAFNLDASAWEFHLLTRPIVFSAATRLSGFWWLKRRQPARLNRGPGTARPQPDTTKLARRTYYDRALKASKALTIVAAARAIVLSDVVVRTWGRGLQPVPAGPGGALSLPVSWLPQGNSITSPKRMNVTHAPACVKNGHFRVLHPITQRLTSMAKVRKATTTKDRGATELVITIN